MNLVWSQEEFDSMKKGKNSFTKRKYTTFRKNLRDLKLIIFLFYF